MIVLLYRREEGETAEGGDVVDTEALGSAGGRERGAEALGGAKHLELPTREGRATLELLHWWTLRIIPRVMELVGDLNDLPRDKIILAQSFY